MMKNLDQGGTWPKIEQEPQYDVSLTITYQPIFVEESESGASTEIVEMLSVTINGVPFYRVEHRKGGVLRLRGIEDNHNLGPAMIFSTKRALERFVSQFASLVNSSQLQRIE